jgi:hypothetical protein
MRSFAARETFGGFTATVVAVFRTLFSFGSAIELLDRPAGFVLRLAMSAPR